MTAVAGAITFLGTMVLLWQQVEPPAPPPTPVAQKLTSGFTLSSNPEIDRLIADLQERQRELDSREQQLKDYEAQLQSQAAELSSITQAVARLQISFDNVVLQIKEEEAANLKKLSKTYATMPPDSAAEILRLLDDKGVIKILTFMKEEDMARILEALARPGQTEAKRVAELSQKLRLVSQRSGPEPATP